VPEVPLASIKSFGQDYQVTLRAIATAGNAKVLSRPVGRRPPIIKPATITVGQSVPLISAVRFDNFGNQIKLSDLPKRGHHPAGYSVYHLGRTVEMILSPETSELVADRSQWVPIRWERAGPSALR